MTAYERLRQIGVSVETADAVGPVLDGLSYPKREAMFLWMIGVPQRQIATMVHVSMPSLHRTMYFIRSKCH